MKFAQEFEVGKPRSAVWNLFRDVPAVAQCMPGAELTGERGDDVYAGRLSVKLGPLNPTFEGEASITVEEETHTLQVSGSGVDRQGGSRGRADVSVELVDRGQATVVSVDADITLSGAAARFGRTGLMEEMASRLIAEFVGCLESKLAAATAGEAATVEAREVRGFSLLVASILAWIRRAARRLVRRSKDT